MCLGYLFEIIFFIIIVVRVILLLVAPIGKGILLRKYCLLICGVFPKLFLRSKLNRKHLAIYIVIFVANIHDPVVKIRGGSSR